MRVLKPHQERNREIIIAALSNYGGSLDASDTGTGKSTGFLAVCKALDARPAIVTRKSIIPGWREECKAMDIEPLFITNYEAARSGGFPYGKAIKKVNAAGKEIVQKYEWNVSGRVIFGFDEVQACRAPKTVNTKMLVAASSRFKTHMLSATPFTDPTEAYGIATSLRLCSQNGYWSWMLRHGVRKNFMGHMEFIGDRPGEKHREEALAIMEKIHADIFPSRGCRTRRSEIPGFPEEVTTAQAVETGEPDAIEREYLKILEELRQADYARARENVPEDLADLIEPLAVTKILRARQKAEYLKCGAIAEMARDAADHGESVAIFVNFDHSLEHLCGLLDTNCVIRGERGAGANNYDRAHAITEFQANRQKFIIVNNAAGGAGVSLHDPVTRKPRTVLISPPQSAVVLTQVLGRTQRLGGGFSTRKLLFAAGTVEERVMQKVQRKMDQLDALTDGDLDVVDVAQ